MLNAWERSCLEYADETLTDPPKWEWTKRVQGRGQLVQRFVLPLELCPTSNQRMRGGLKQRFAEAALKKTVAERMLIQAGRRWRTPLSGRPLVLAVRFTTQATDVSSDWSKVPVDRLLPAELGIIVDDSPKHIDLNCWSEYAPRGKGFVLLEIWSGEEPKKRSKRRRKA